MYQTSEGLSIRSRLVTTLTTPVDRFVLGQEATCHQVEPFVASAFGSYIVEKLFREHYCEKCVTSATGAFHDVSDRSSLLDKISTLIPEEWIPQLDAQVANRNYSVGLN